MRLGLPARRRRPRRCRAGRGRARPTISDSLLDEHYQWLLRNNPTYATALGVRDYDDRIPDLSERGARAAGRARPRPSSPGSTPSRPTSSRQPTGSPARSCAARSAEAIEADGFGQRDMLFTTYDGWHQDFAGLALQPAVPQPRRLRKLSHPDRPISAAQRPGAGDHRQRGARRLRPALLGARRPRAHHLRRDHRGSGAVALLRAVHPARGRRASARPTGRRCRRGRGGSSRERSTPPISKHLDFYRTQYLPHCARSDSVSAQPAAPNIMPSRSACRRPPT